LWRSSSSGDVFLCKHKADKNYYYALKKIKTIEIDEKERENIENELKILQKLRHINIVSYKDSFTD
jgi:serine/threonine protein kinase